MDKGEEFGHWEIDTVIGKRTKDKVLLMLTEKKTRKHIIFQLESRSVEEVNRAIE